MEHDFEKTKRAWTAEILDQWPAKFGYRWLQDRPLSSQL